MKKEYEEPQLAVVRLSVESCILAGSGEIVITPGTSASEGQRSKAWSADNWSTERGDEETIEN